MKWNGYILWGGLLTNIARNQFRRRVQVCRARFSNFRLKFRWNHRLQVSNGWIGLCVRFNVSLYISHFSLSLSPSLVASYCLFSFGVCPERKWSQTNRQRCGGGGRFLSAKIRFHFALVLSSLSWKNCESSMEKKSAGICIYIFCSSSSYVFRTNFTTAAAATTVTAQLFHILFRFQFRTFPLEFHLDSVRCLDTKLSQTGLLQQRRQQQQQRDFVSPLEQSSLTVGG